MGFGYLDPADERDARLIAVAADEIARAVATPSALVLAFPRDRRLRAAVESALLDLAGRPTLRELGAAAG